MVGNPGTLLLTAGIFILGSSKTPKWISIILVIPLVMFMCVTILIEKIVAKIFFKYEAEFINSKDTEEFRESKRKWLDEHIGNKNYITTGFSQNKKKRKKSSENTYAILEVEKYVCFKRNEDRMYYVTAWMGFNEK